MNVPETGSNLTLKLLSLAVALLLWLFVSYGRETTLSLQVPVQMGQLSSGLVLAGGLPASVAVTVSGPKILVRRLADQSPRLALDLEGVHEGKVVFPDLAKLLHLPAGVHVIRIYPAALELHLEKSAGLPGRR
jgi:hypothetical protein